MLIWNCYIEGRFFLIEHRNENYGNLPRFGIKMIPNNLFENKQVIFVVT